MLFACLQAPAEKSGTTLPPGGSSCMMGQKNPGDGDRLNISRNRIFRQNRGAGRGMSPSGRKLRLEMQNDFMIYYSFRETPGQSW